MSDQFQRCRQPSVQTWADSEEGGEEEEESGSGRWCWSVYTTNLSISSRRQQADGAD